MPERVQLSRRKGWRMSANTVSVARPTKWGNPFKIVSFKQARGGRREYSVQLNEGVDSFIQSAYEARMLAVSEYRRWLSLPRPLDERRWDWQLIERQSTILDSLHDLRGKNLACWCPLDQPCHADVLLEIANRGDE